MNYEDPVTAFSVGTSPFRPVPEVEFTSSPGTVESRLPDIPTAFPAPQGNSVRIVDSQSMT